MDLFRTVGVHQASPGIRRSQVVLWRTDLSIQRCGYFDPGLHCGLEASDNRQDIACMLQNRDLQRSLQSFQN